MVLPLDALWFVVLILFLAIFSTAYLMSARVWFALILVVIVAGFALTIVSMVRAKVQVASDETMLLEYLKSHGIGGNLSELAASLSISEEKALKLLLSMEEQGTIPAGSLKVLGASPPDDGTT